jgi:hypothetical protein
MTTDALERIAAEQRSRPVHAVKIGAGKWGLGRALCGCTLGRWTPTSANPEEVTCPRCKARVSK